MEVLRLLSAVVVCLASSQEAAAVFFFRKMSVPDPSEKTKCCFLDFRGSRLRDISGILSLTQAPVDAATAYR
jgi:hypothetical protein